MRLAWDWHEAIARTVDVAAFPRAGSTMELDDITGEVIRLAIQIHRDLGPGLLESVYDAILARLLEREGLRIARHPHLRFTYEGLDFGRGLQPDLVVEEKVIVELKSVERLDRVHPKTVLTYLRLSGLPVGLLLNFGAPTLREGLHRIVNDLDPSASPRLRVNRS